MSHSLAKAECHSRNQVSPFVRWWKTAIKNWQLYALILPAVAAVFVFHYIPIYGIQIAFKDFRSSLEANGSG